MKHTFFVVLILCINSISAKATTNYTLLSNEDIYILIDNAIDNFSTYKKERNQRISILKYNLKQARTDEDRYLWLHNIFNEYMGFESDSAAVYIDLAQNMATTLGKQDWINTTKLQQASFLASQGIINKADKLIASIDINSLTPYQKSEFYEHKIKILFYEELYMRQQDNDYVNGNIKGDFLTAIEQARDSMMKYAPPRDSKDLAMKSWIAIGEGDNWQNMQPYKEQLLRSIVHSDLSNFTAANECYVLSRIFKTTGDLMNSSKYAALSVLSSVCSGELSSFSTAMEELCHTFLTDGNIERAYKYINFSYHNSVDYNDRARAVFIGHLQNKINLDYVAYNRKIAERKEVYFILLCCLLTIVLGALTFIAIQNRNLARHRHELHDANSRLQELVHKIQSMNDSLVKASKVQMDLNSQLDNANKQLIESNYIKEQYLGYAFSVCSQYISKLEAYRKSVFKCIRDGLQKELKKLVTFPILEQTELKEFYRNFDNVFLTIYPNFVSDLNKILKPEEQILLNDGSLLNTEIRILALMRLGITDIDKMADFLHCSVQTVYNCRQKMYNRTDMLKKDFKNAVANLGSPAIGHDSKL
jgi:hypothetical protein